MPLPLYEALGEEVADSKTFTVTITAAPETKGKILEYDYAKELIAGQEIPREKLVWGRCKNTSNAWEYFYLQVVDEDTGKIVCMEEFMHFVAPGEEFTFKLPDTLAITLPKAPETPGTWRLRLELRRWWAF